MQEMASAADIQAGNIAEINTTVGHLDTMTEQNAAMAEQATAASDSRSSEARQLLAMVSGFRTDDEPMGRAYKMAVRAWRCPSQVQPVAQQLPGHGRNRQRQARCGAAGGCLVRDAAEPWSSRSAACHCLGWHKLGQYGIMTACPG